MYMTCTITINNYFVVEFVCPSCNVGFDFKSKYLRHIKSSNHIWHGALEMTELMEDQHESIANSGPGLEETSNDSVSQLKITIRFTRSP